VLLESAYPYVPPTIAGGVQYPPPATYVQLQNIQGEGGETLYSLKITVPAGVAAPPTAPQVVMVYSLRATVTALAESVRGFGTPATQPESRQEMYRKAMDDALSLIKTVLDMTPDHSAPEAEIRVHMETGTLIVKGTPEQQNAVNAALAAIRPNLDAPPPPGWANPGPGFFGAGGPPTAPR
jgi:hypothetical protein